MSMMTGRHSTWVETDDDHVITQAAYVQWQHVMSLLEDSREYVVRRHPAYWKGGKCRLIVDVVLLHPGEADVGEIVSYGRLWRKPGSRWVEYHRFDDDLRDRGSPYRFLEAADRVDPFYMESLIGWERIH